MKGNRDIGHLDITESQEERKRMNGTDVNAKEYEVTS